ncbi:MAG: right-handed parallel beta-helix repeat-containing protein [Candidatus Aenigmatarchaeota archaeon]
MDAPLRYLIIGLIFAILILIYMKISRSQEILSNFHEVFVLVFTNKMAYLTDENVTLSIFTSSDEGEVNLTINGSNSEYSISGILVNGNYSTQIGGLAPGNYTVIGRVYVNGSLYQNFSSFEIIDYEKNNQNLISLGEDIQLQILLNGPYEIGKDMVISILGYPHTNFTIEIFRGKELIIKIENSTDENGNFTYNLPIEYFGNYTIKFNYLNKSEERRFMIQPKIEFKFERNVFDDEVNFLFFGEQNSNYSMEIVSENYFSIFNFSTDDNGTYIFSNNFQPGNYSVFLIGEGGLSEWFLVSGSNGDKNEIKNVELEEFKFITTDGLNWVLEEDVPKILINANQVSIDCKGHRLGGITIENSSEIMINNCIIEGSEIGLFSKNSKKIEIINNTITKNKHGVVIFGGDHIKVIENLITGNDYYGILFFGTSNYQSENNQIENRFDINLLEKLKNL